MSDDLRHYMQACSELRAKLAEAEADLRTLADDYRLTDLYNANQANLELLGRWTEFDPEQPEAMMALDLEAIKADTALGLAQWERALAKHPDDDEAFENVEHYRMVLQFIAALEAAEAEIQVLAEAGVALTRSMEAAEADARVLADGYRLTDTMLAIGDLEAALKRRRSDARRQG